MPNYASTREINGLTGDTVVSRGKEFSSVEPAAQVVLIVLRTLRGSCLADKSLGVEWNKVKDRASAIRAMQAALAPYERQGRLADVKCDAEDKGNGLFLVQVDFKDPRRPTAPKQSVSTSVRP